MKRLLILIVLVGALLWAEGFPVCADVLDAKLPDSIADFGKQVVTYIAENGEAAYLYDLVGDDKGSRGLFKLTLFEPFDVVNLDGGVAFDSLENEPALVAGIGTSVSKICTKLGVKWDLPFDVSVGVLGGYDFAGDGDWIAGPQIAVKIAIK